MAFPKKGGPRPNVVTTRLSDLDLQGLKLIGGANVCAALQAAVEQFLSERAVKIPVRCAWCGKRLGTTFFTREQIDQLPKKERGKVTSDGICEPCRDETLRKDAAA